MMEKEDFDIGAFRPYSKRHIALSWWAMTVLAIIPLLFFLGKQLEIALFTVLVFIAFVALDPVARTLLTRVPVARDRIFSSVCLYVIVAVLSIVHGGLAAIAMLFGVATIGLFFSRRSKFVWEQLIETQEQ